MTNVLLYQYDNDGNIVYFRGIANTWKIYTRLQEKAKVFESEEEALKTASLIGLPTNVCEPTKIPENLC